jgi:hypothetical protein
MLSPKVCLGLYYNARLATYIETPSLFYNYLGQDL